MMNIDHKSIKVYKESVTPSINFTVSENLEDDTILLKVEGIVLGADWKYIASIVELPDIKIRGYPTTIDGRLITQASKAISIMTDNNDNDNNKNNLLSKTKPLRLVRQEFLFTLNKKILDHIEELRQKSKNNDVILYFVFRSSYIKHSLKLSAYTTKTLQENYKADPKILVTQDKENKVLFHMVDEFRRQVIIPSNEWINNFQEQLRNFD
jgi:hypothetical protein